MGKELAPGEVMRKIGTFICGCIAIGLLVVGFYVNNDLLFALGVVLTIAWGGYTSMSPNSRRRPRA